MKDLWPHQIKARDMILKEYRNGNKWVCNVIPTGGGKTALACSIAAQTCAKNIESRILWMVHRSELVEQAYDELTEWGLSCGVIQSTPTRTVNPYRQVQVASIQTLLARELRPENIKLVIPDECHHSVSNQWISIFEHYKKLGAWGLGLTATPLRGDNLPLGEIFDSLVCPVTTAELIQDGFLVPFDLQRPRSMLKKGQIAQRPVDAYTKFAVGRKTIVFAPNKKSATEFAMQFRSAGIPSEMAHGLMPFGERKEIFDKYRRGEISVLTNVGLTTEGFDDRPTSCVIIARKVGSLSLLRQMLGRALRISPETNKRDAVLLDLHGSTYMQGGIPNQEPMWSLGGEGIRKKILESPPERFCLLCGVLIEDFEATICPDCGTERPGQVMPEVINQELIKYAWKRRETPEQRVVTLRRWIADADSKGWKRGAAYHRFRAVYGSYPSSDIIDKL